MFVFKLSTSSKLYVFSSNVKLEWSVQTRWSDCRIAAAYVDFVAQPAAEPEKRLPGENLGQNCRSDATYCWPTHRTWADVAENITCNMWCDLGWAACCPNAERKDVTKTFLEMGSACANQRKTHLRISDTFVFRCNSTMQECHHDLHMIIYHIRGKWKKLDKYK